MHNFWNKVSINQLNECWLWNACLDKKGYGKFQKYYAHRYSWILIYGEIPDKLFVLHKCDNPRCVNPNHLFLGTQQDNLKDMRNKNRATYVNGEKHGRVKFSNELIKEIRNQFEMGKSLKEVSILYPQISYYYLSRIKNNRAR